MGLQTMILAAGLMGAGVFDMFDGIPVAIEYALDFLGLQMRQMSCVIEIQVYMLSSVVAKDVALIVDASNTGTHPRRD